MFVGPPIKEGDVRTLDLTALRALVTVTELGGVTKAATHLNLTQSAVSMQLKRLEDSLGQSLIDRSARQIGLTPQGELMLGYARRLLALNDEAIARMTSAEFEGEVRFGVPTDIVYPHIPSILKRFDRAFPRVRVNLYSSNTKKLRAMLAESAVDLILTTEGTASPECETLLAQPIVWVGAPGGNACRQRPLRVAFERECIFRQWALRALDVAGIPWENAVDTQSTRTVEASVSADLAVHAMIGHAASPQFEIVGPEAGLPRLPKTMINMYIRRGAGGAPLAALAEYLREAYGVSRRKEVA
ncbi:MAG: LysR substrate-binding domain-containing protein [Pseudomonadota bacterium]